MATYCTPVTSPAMLPATSTASHTLATRNRSSPTFEVHSPDHTVRTARSFSGWKTGSISGPRHSSGAHPHEAPLEWRGPMRMTGTPRSLHPHPAVLVLVAERQVG